MTVVVPQLRSIAHSLNGGKVEYLGEVSTGSTGVLEIEPGSEYKLPKGADLNKARQELKISGDDSIKVAARDVGKQFMREAVLQNGFGSPQAMQDALKESLRKTAKHWHEVVDPESPYNRIERTMAEPKRRILRPVS